MVIEPKGTCGNDHAVCLFCGLRRVGTANPPRCDDAGESCFEAEGCQSMTAARKRSAAVSGLIVLTKRPDPSSNPVGIEVRGHISKCQ